MITERFPKLPGLSWTLKFSPNFNNIIQKPVVLGKELRLNLDPQPQWKIECNYNYLHDMLPPDETSETELEKIRGLFLKMNGSFGAFWLNPTDLTQDPDDSEVNGMILGTGDGVNRAFQVIRDNGGFNEECYDVFDPTVSVQGVEVDPSTYTITDGVLLFTVAPANTFVVMINYFFFYRVRFELDSLSFDTFMYQLYELKSVSLMSLKP